MCTRLLKGIKNISSIMKTHKKIQFRRKVKCQDNNQSENLQKCCGRDDCYMQQESFISGYMNCNYLFGREQ